MTTAEAYAKLDENKELLAKLQAEANLRMYTRC